MRSGIEIATVDANSPSLLVWEDIVELDVLDVTLITFSGSLEKSFVCNVHTHGH